MKLPLNENWKLLYRDLDAGADQISEIETAGDFIDAGALPCDIRMPLIRDGIIKDPIIADYCYESEWVEGKSWWFKNEFELSREDISADQLRLVLESLDNRADIFVNARHVGTHQSCHYPFEAEIREFSGEGSNTLIIRLTAGHEAVTPGENENYICTEAANGRGDRGDKRRAALRKPQYVYGWDWSPRVVTIGIMKNAYIYINSEFAITHVHPVVLEADAENSRAKMRFEVQFESYHPIATADVEVKLDMRLGNETVLDLRKDVLAQSGVNFVSFDAVVENARLWWPNGAGEQPLYTISASLMAGEIEYFAPPVRTGIRTVALNLEKLGSGRRKYAITVNGTDIFCKGGNWVPADSIYARVTPKKYEALIREARECNFNMLRVWGGGSYERDEFYELCDQYGILVWQDFMFACSLYPDDQEWFFRECKREIDYQTKRLRHHPCLALWNGNNECQFLFEDALSERSGGLRVFNSLAPSLVHANCPEIPYWRSSPYGGEHPNANEVGNRHHWADCTMNEDMAKRVTPEEYDKVTSAFVSEYGYIGPCSDETIRKYFGGNDAAKNSRVWNLHNNTFEQETVPVGIRKHYTEPDGLALPDYLKYARLVQGLMYSYSLESIRFFEHSAGSLFWMYNDAWGEVGWSIIDYYLDRKPSYYYVKRSFAPVKMILRRSADHKKVCVMGVNDTPDMVGLTIEYGYVSFNGEYDTARREITLPPFSKAIVMEFDMPDKDTRQGLIFARAEGIPLALLRTGDFKDYSLAESRLTVEEVSAVGKDLLVTVKSSGYSHAVSFGLAASFRLSDEYFDMLPGESRTVVIYDAAGIGKPSDLHHACRRSVGHDWRFAYNAMNL